MRQVKVSQFSNKIGFMQGRLSPLQDGKIQAFPWLYWQDEFKIASKLGFKIMEWTLDRDDIFKNPIMIKEGRKEIKELCQEYDFLVETLTGDFLMQVPFYKGALDKQQVELDIFKKVIESSANFGIKYIVMPLVDNGRLENKEQEELLITTLHELQPLLKQEKISIIFETDYVPIEYNNFLQHLDKNSFGVNFDIGNSAAFGFDFAEEMKLYGDRILNVHVKDRIYQGTTVPLGKGDANLGLAFHLLKENNYKGDYILQTARAEDGKHSEVLSEYKQMVIKFLEEA